MAKDRPAGKGHARGISACYNPRCSAGAKFTRACQEQNILQRIVLPQPREDFLNAVSNDGTPDFTAAERAEARKLLDSPHVIHEQIVCRSADRKERFADVNLEIVRASDVVV